MNRLTIRHETLYTYEKPVRFGPQRLLVRPRDSHAIRLIDASLELSPPGETRWTYDALDNCLCWFQPLGEATSLRIVSSLIIDRYPSPLVPLAIDDPRSLLPMAYDLADRAALAPFLIPVADDKEGALLRWVREQMHDPGEPALDFLQRLNETIHARFSYGERQEEGVQAPAETLARGTGTCRDFAWLMVEALRRLGFAARFVTGYLYSPKLDRPDSEGGVRGAGATHAWCEVFLPGLGWLEFDPTNGLVESPDLIRIGATLTPAEAAPISGGVIGDCGSSTLHVAVEVHAVDAGDAEPANTPAALHNN